MRRCSSIIDCTPARPDWLRKQMRFREWNKPPRKFATYTWCALPAIYDDWSKHWTGRKGTGPYRCTNPCIPDVPTCHA